MAKPERGESDDSRAEDHDPGTHLRCQDGEGKESPARDRENDPERDESDSATHQQ